MNNDLKIKINELREMGYGYKRIAKELSMTTSAVRYACIKTDDVEELTSNCLNCNLKIKSMKGKKAKKFCSDKCRWHWWNTHKDDVKRNAFYTFKCPFCNSEFVAYGNSKRIYCSVSCIAKNRTKRGNEQ